MSFLKKLGKGLIKPLDQLARSERVGKTVRVTASVGVSAIPGFGLAQSLSQRRGLKGLGRGAVGFLPFGNVAVTAYDLKRGRDKAQAQKGKYRRAIRSVDEQIRSYGARIHSLRVATTPLDSGAGPLAALQTPDLGTVITPLVAQTLPGAVGNGAQDAPGGITPLNQDRPGAPVASTAEEDAQAPVLAGPGSKLGGFLILGALAWWLLKGGQSG